ncbi:hypothetical protein WJX72_011671 [[Myrmecia] bisecta]|uniref:Uncharacterized protein n=1 Tax=[Myrmecia] bisecta TaxID=41462 RepID=A0AAW1RA21_9CHLO
MPSASAWPPLFLAGDPTSQALQGRLLHSTPWTCRKGAENRGNVLRVVDTKPVLAIHTTIFVAPVSHAQAQSSVVVQNTFDLAFALWSQVPNIYLQGSLVLTPDGLPPNPFTISDRNVTIQPVANATGIVTLDFGSLQTSHRVTVTNGAVVTLKRLQLKNYFFASLETRSYDTFMPFFVVEEQGRLQLTDIQMSMDPHRCQSRSDYPKFAESVRTPWLISLEPSTFQGGFVADANSNITYLVKSALVPQNYMRVSLTTVVPAQVGGHVQLAGTSFFCPPSSAPVPDAVAIASRVWANDQLNLALTQLDSRTILLQQNFSISTATSQPLVIANYRTISLLPAGTQDPKDDPTAMMDITLTSNATSDMWQVGYSGTLSISAITLRLASPCCTQLQLGSGWYFAGTLLAWRLFDTVLPASIQVLAVRYATLTPPAQMALTNVTLTYATCNESSWMPAVTQLESLTASPNASPMMAVYDRAARTLNCANCTFLGTAAEGPILLNQTSIVRLINTTA